MKPFERRAAAAYPYYKLAVWDARNLTWMDGREAFPSEADAVAAAKAPGRYRVSRVTATGRMDLPPFSV
jgi:hypothetical protein